MAKDLTPGETAAIHLTLGEQLVQLVKESGLLKPKRKRIVRRRKKRAATKAEAPALKRVAKKAPKRVERAEEPDETEDVED